MPYIIIISVISLFFFSLITVYRIGKSNGYSEGSSRRFKALKELYGNNFLDHLQDNRTDYGKKALDSKGELTYEEYLQNNN